ncbi:interferon-induced protein 44-like isoform X2 [Argopecten irradians]|uniref:interferon-induced protein 44-like isoform X2 n=1 Tax=Argopecten irradians TaxID=31199 RepID=UPI00371347B6
MSTLTQSQKNQIYKWIGSLKMLKFTLLYKISRDGCSSKTFHTLCDNKGPTVTVLYNTDNSVYGGYTAVNWNSSKVTYDAKAFLFKLDYNGCEQPNIFPVKNNGTNAIFGASGYGPSFGADGSDLCCFTDSVNKSGTSFPLNGNASKLGHTYDLKGENYFSVMNGHLQVVDLEVYRVEEQELFQKPWVRDIEWSQQLEEDLKDKVASYKPLPGLDLQQARILLVGQVGAGKSSYFNTINSIFRGHISAQANAGSAEHSLTTAFNPAVPLSPDALGFVKKPTLSDKIHCVAFVVDGSTVDVSPEKVLERIKAMQIRMNQRGIPQVVLLTKIDKIWEEISDDVSKVYFSPAMKECVDKVAMVMGLPRSHVLPVKNYEFEVELDQNTNILALLSLRRLLHFVDDFLYNRLDEIEDQQIQRVHISE